MRLPFCQTHLAAILLLTFAIAAGQDQRAAGGNKGAPVSAQAIEEPVVLETPAGKLFGTLDVPKSPAPVPVALIIAGSGPTDRNGNNAMLSGANNSLKLLAEGLAARGIASLRYDKRGIAESASAVGREEDLRFDTYINDAILWARKLRADKRFTSLTIIGHSEGSLIGMVVARELKADAYVSLAGAGRAAPQILLEQLNGKLTPELYKQTESVLKELVEGKTVAQTPPQLAALFRPSVQPYLISWFQYDPAKEIAKLTAPVLIAQGTKDAQVSLQDAKLLSQAKPAARLLLVDGMNHTLKDVAADDPRQVKAYADPTLPVDAKLIEAIADLIRSLRK